MNPWSDTREKLLPTVFLFLHHCWNAWRYFWRGHVTPPHSCDIQVFIDFAWQREMCLPQRYVATVAGRHSRSWRHRFPLLLRNCRVYSGTAWANPLQYYKKDQYGSNREHSTIHPLLGNVERITLSFNNKVTVSLFLDFERPFDRFLPQE
jgi:hypothetical protein